MYSEAKRSEEYDEGFRDGQLEATLDCEGAREDELEEMYQEGFRAGEASLGSMARIVEGLDRNEDVTLRWDAPLCAWVVRQGKVERIVR